MNKLSRYDTVIMKENYETYLKDRIGRLVYIHDDGCCSVEFFKANLKTDCIALIPSEFLTKKSTLL